MRGTFIINAHDREIIAWVTVGNAGISASNIGDVMPEAEEARFGSMRTAKPVEMLSYSGAAYNPAKDADPRTAIETSNPASLPFAARSATAFPKLSRISSKR